MALGTPTLATPTLGAAGTNVTTAAFTPTLSALLSAFGTCRLNGLPGAITITPSALTWIPLIDSIEDLGSGVRVRGSLWAAIASSTPSMTVRIDSASAGRVVLAVSEITGPSGIPGNSAGAPHSAGDPSIVLPSAPAVSSTVVAFYGAGGAAAVTPPAGFTELTEFLQTDLTLHSCYDAVSAPTTVTYSTTNSASVGLAVEIEEASGAGLRLPRRGIQFQHMLMR